MGVAFHVASRLQQPMAMPHQQTQFRDLRIGNARGLGVSGEDQAGDGLRVDLVVASLADARAAAGIGLQRVEDHAGVAAASQFVVQAHPVVAGGFHADEHLARPSCLAENILLQLIHAWAGVGKRGKLSDDLALGREGRGRVFSLSNVDADDGAAAWEHGLTFQGLLHVKGSFWGLTSRASADRRGPAIEEDLRVIRLIQNLVVIRGVRRAAGPNRLIPGIQAIR